LVTFEGIDGAGKTTQLERAVDWLKASGILGDRPLVVTREPGGTALGQQIRHLLLSGDWEVADRTELLLYAADRAQHVQQRIEPALAAGHWVLSDRYCGSTAAYQGYGRGLPLPLIEQLAAIATGGLQPDLTLLLELPLAEALRRRQQRPADRIEASGEAFLQRVCDGFAALAQQPGWCRIPADQPLEAVTAAIQAALTRHCDLPAGGGVCSDG